MGQAAICNHKSLQLVASGWHLDTARRYDDCMNLGFGEMMFLFVLGLLLFGPKKLPEIGRQLGKFMGDFKRASQEFQSQLNDEVRQLEEETKKIDEPEALAPS